MENFLTAILTFLTQGGTVAVIAILFLLVVALIWERRKLYLELTATTLLVYASKDKENSSIKEIVDKYYKGNLDLVQALNEIKIVLITIQNTKR
jgi:aromatic ring hydroxylase